MKYLIYYIYCVNFVKKIFCIGRYELIGKTAEFNNDGGSVFILKDISKIKEIYDCEFIKDRNQKGSICQTKIERGLIYGVVGMLDQPHTISSEEKKKQGPVTLFVYENTTVKIIKKLIYQDWDSLFYMDYKKNEVYL